ncbi:MAG: septum site-determining protein MinC [Firmicutes bacterium]|nr:septum site-determining protein MinC [Bacillota bacterium]
MLCERLEAELAELRPGNVGSAVTIDVGARLLTTSQLLELEAIVNRYVGVRIVQIIDSAGTGWPEAAPEPAPEPAAAAAAAPALARTPAPEGGRAEIRVERLPLRRPPAAPLGAEGEPAQLIRRTVRSGQRIVSAGHVVVLGDVNPGAEVVAGGDIIVMGCLRGLAHAGARGDEAAVIAAIRLEPMQLRIAHHISRPPDDDVHSAPGPEVARVRNGVIVIESYHDLAAGVAM